MEARLILPNDRVFVNSKDAIFFTAGPIQDGGNWQRQAIKLLAERKPGAYIACPYRYGTDDELSRFRAPMASEEQWQMRGLSLFSRQTMWERYYLAVAGLANGDERKGAVLFWLPEEDCTNPRPKEAGPYARDTYGELGEWRARMLLQRARVVIGAEPGFPGLSIIEANFKGSLGQRFKIHTTLEATVKAAVALAELD